MAEADHKYDCLLLDHQLCFPLYACSKEIIRRYKPMLDELDLTYTQYIFLKSLRQRAISTGGVPEQTSAIWR